jgi:hypothetical protein
LISIPLLLLHLPLFWTRQSTSSRYSIDLAVMCSAILATLRWNLARFVTWWPFSSHTWCLGGNFNSPQGDMPCCFWVVQYIWQMCLIDHYDCVNHKVVSKFLCYHENDVCKLLIMWVLLLGWWEYFT